MWASWKRDLIVAAVIASFAVGYRIYSESAGPRFEAGLKKLEAEVKSKLPIKVDETTTLIDVRYEPTSTIYWYVVDVDKVDPAALENFKRKIQENACGNAEVRRTIKDKGFTYDYRYANRAGAPLTAFVISECP